MVKILFSFIFFFLITSCSKLVYITQQGYGQLKIQWTARSIKEVMEDPNVDADIKEKIQSIQNYKKYFYDYFEREVNSIYSEVTFLKDPAVTHLVISSYFNEVKAHMEWFPFVGEFPYIGFFKKDNALDYAKNMEEDGYFTYVRPVYAYSSLGYFEDKILSSFFQYDEYGLSELIFHELFHTVFFVKDNVDFNENLANYFGKELMFEFFKLSDKKKSDVLLREQKNRKLRDRLVELITEYKKILEAKTVKSKEESEGILREFVQVRFLPEIQKKCREYKIKNCYLKEGEWNNARFVAYMTYEKKMNFIKKIREKNSFSLSQLLKYLEDKYKEYEEIDKKKGFQKYLEEIQ